MPVWLTTAEHQLLTTVLDTVIPGDDESPGAGEVGGADYVDVLLGAFEFDPPRIWSRQPASRGAASWLELGSVEALAWRTRIEGSCGIPEREFNGPVIGWQSRYRDGLATLGADFAEVGPAERRERLRRADPQWRQLLFDHACEALYGDPNYGGNRDRAGWRAIGFDGDVQPRGWTPLEVTGTDADP